MRRLGLLLIVVGLIWGIVAFNMSTSVKVGGSGKYSSYVPEEVHNIGLMDQRRNQIFISAVLIICGVILFGFGTVSESKKTIPVSAESSSELEKLLGNEQKKCPSCAENIKLEALKCKHCGEVFEPSDIARQVEERKAKMKKVKK
jgi:hypothetical protein